MALDDCMVSRAQGRSVYITVYFICDGFFTSVLLEDIADSASRLLVVRACFA